MGRSMDRTFLSSSSLEEKKNRAHLHHIVPGFSFSEEKEKRKKSYRAPVRRLGFLSFLFFSRHREKKRNKDLSPSRRLHNELGDSLWTSSYFSSTSRGGEIEELV